MAKTLITDLISKIKRKSDYNIIDTDLDTLILDDINSSLKLIKQWLMDYGIFKDVSKSESIKTVEGQEYVDLNIARIVGDTASFTAVAADTITVTIDGTAYTTAALTGAVLVATVVTAINLAVGTTVATESDDGYLVITSPTSGGSVTIASGAGTPVSRLFTVAAERTQSAIADVDEIISLTERTNDTPITEISYDELKALYPDPSANASTTPDYFARFVDRLYFGPTPDDNILLYVDYILQITEVTSASTCPLNNKYDPLIIALGVKAMAEFLEPDNANRIASANKNVEFWNKQLITGASKNIGLRRGTASRKPEIPYFSPRKVV